MWVAGEFTDTASAIVICDRHSTVRKTRPTSETEFASVKLAFFHRISAWADALEDRDTATARQELRHIDVLAERLLQDDLFLKAAATRRIDPSELVGCLTTYLAAITDSIGYAETPAPSDAEMNGESDGESQDVD